MSAWGPGGAAKSCDTLLQRVEQNDPTLSELVILSSKTFGPQQVERLSAAIATGRNTNLQSLSASGHALPPSSLELLGAAIAKKRSGLVCLAIGDKNMRDDGAVALCAGLGNGGGGLQELDLEWKNLSTNGMASLGTTFGPSPSIQTLNLSRNERIKDDGIVAFCTTASIEQPSFPSLQELNLAECGIGPVGIKSLVKLLTGSSSTQARSLSLICNGNPLGPESCRSLSTLLCDSSRVSSLSMSKCNIGNEGIQILSNAVASSTCGSLTMLDISDNNIGANGTEALALSLASGQATCCWPKLVDLRLAKNNLSERGVVSLMNALTLNSNDSRNQVLHALDLTQTNCGVKGAAAAVKCTSLSSLRLFNNKLGSEGFETLAPLLQGGHVSLVNLDLGGNDASEAAVVKLLNAIAEPAEFVSVLRVLEIGGNQGGNDVEEAVKRLKQVHPELDVARDRPKVQQDN